MNLIHFNLIFTKFTQQVKVIMKCNIVIAENFMKISYLTTYNSNIGIIIYYLINNLLKFVHASLRRKMILSYNQLHLKLDINYIIR